ncbi:MAG: patatin-like phospholipase family protein [Bacteroidales bacterium]|jgi:NTE family protein|nr:patatin-like phospholipase family protein [Bacteroidales bacterium]MDD4385132.1 patatin-like phospholipase family protein [Bacteroidales bacterium]MDY0197708.1 patatin-like phospholipase family protein [Tenuifilaceae bacterium]
MSKKLALALSSGGARGLVHIGVIDELEQRGFDIVSLSGSSMGALVGSMYAAGTLNDFKDWITTLTRMEVLRLVDFTLASKGFIKGERIFDEMQKRGFIPDINIEDLPKPMVILATDIINNKEIVFKKGSLVKAIRASISIPNVFTPIEIANGLLVDGGVLNPLPISHLITKGCDLIGAVDTNALIPYKKPTHEVVHVGETDEEKSLFDQLKEKWYEFFEGDEKKKLKESHKLGYFDLLYRVLQVMMSNMTQKALEETPPNFLVQTSKDACGVYEFYRAKELIAYGQKACAEALDKAKL